MFCKSCGSALAENARFCPSCGAAVSVPEQPVQPVYQQPVQPVYQQPVQPVYQQPVQPVYQQPEQPVYQQPVQPAYQQPVQVIVQPVVQTPMKWFKFLIYFALFAGAILNAFAGIQMLSGAHYGNNGESTYVYAFFDGLQTLDMIMGILMIALAGFALYVRFRLAGFYKNGPTMLLINYVANIVVGLIYVIGITSIVSSELLGDSLTSYYTNVATSVAMTVANYSYFKKRAHMFTR